MKEVTSYPEISLLSSGAISSETVCVGLAPRLIQISTFSRFSLTASALALGRMFQPVRCIDRHAESAGHGRRYDKRAFLCPVPAETNSYTHVIVPSPLMKGLGIKPNSDRSQLAHPLHHLFHLHELFH